MPLRAQCLRRRGSTRHLGPRSARSGSRRLTTFPSSAARSQTSRNGWRSSSGRGRPSQPAGAGRPRPREAGSDPRRRERRPPAPRPSLQRRAPLVHRARALPPEQQELPAPRRRRKQRRCRRREVPGRQGPRAAARARAGQPLRVARRRAVSSRRYARGTRTRSARGTISNATGVVPGCSPSSAIGSREGASTVTARPRRSSIFGCPRWVPR
jgi:hypothetical protein